MNSLRYWDYQARYFSSEINYFESFCLSLLDWQGWFCPQSFVIDVINIPPSPKVVYSKENDKIRVKIDEVEEFLIGPSDLGSIRHNYTFRVLSEETDKKLSVIGSKGSSDVMTPDYIIKNDIGWVVCEFGTCFSTNDRVLQNQFDKKKIKYIDELRKRTNSFYFGIVIVGPTVVKTNLPLSRDVLEVLVMRYHVSLKIEEMLKADGFVLPDHDISIDIRAVQGTIKSFEFKEFSDLFCKKLMENVRKPPNMEHVQEILIKAIEDSVNPKEICTFGEELQKYKDSCIGKNMYIKPIINLPFINSDFLPGNDLQWHEMDIKPVDFISNLMQSLFLNIKFGKGGFYEEHADIELAIAKEEREPDQDLRKKYRRAIYTVDRSTLRQLAFNGWDGKSFKYDEIVLEKRKQNKEKFSLEVYTDDIDHFINNTESAWMRTPNNFTEPSHELIEEAMSIWGAEKDWAFSDHVMPFVNFFVNSSMGQYCSLVSSIGSEISVSRTQNCTHHSAIVKRVRNTGVYLILRPTHGDGLINYIIAFLNDYVHHPLDSSVFQSITTDGTWSWTQNLTVKTSKLQNWVKAESIGLSCFFFACDYWNVNPEDLSCLETSGNVKKALKLTNLLILVNLHDKRATEEVMTLFRYLVLEQFVSPPEPLRPEKLLSKLPAHMKNRMEVWAVKKFITEAHRIKTSDTIELYCPFTHEKLNDMQQLVNTFYYGYLCNKEETPEANTIGKILEKIISQENLYPNEETFCGLEEKIDELSYHEFSLDMLFTCVDFFLARITRQTGCDAREYIGRLVDESLARERLENISSLKASSEFTEDWEKYDPEKKYRRSKVAAKLIKLIDDKSFRLVDLLTMSLNSLEERGGLPCCIFRKPQHGGLREIFVLTIEGRIVQRTLEVIAKTICSLIPSETMTHPENKYEIPESHKKVIKQRLDDNTSYMAYSVSDDAEKWSQRHCSSKFFLMLARMLPDRYHNFLFRSLALWNNKKMLIDSTLLRLFDQMSESLDDFEMYSPETQQLYDAFTGKKSVVWLKEARQPYLTIKSGMMQGILHYTSSLLHSIYLEYFNSVLTTFIQDSIRENKLVKADFNSFHLQSSDDSSLTINYLVYKNTPEKELFLSKISSIIFRLKGQLSKFVGIYESEKKKKSNTKNFMEFNSEFYISSNIYKPVVKFVGASQNILETESLVARQEECYNLISSIPENGGSFILAAGCQYAQALLHYRLLGSTLSPIFTEYCQEIKRTRDPSCGFFLLDFPPAAGVGGFNFCFYQNVKKSQLLKCKYNYLLSRIHNTDYHSEETKVELREQLESTSTGLFTKNICVPMGDRKKWHALIATVSDKFFFKVGDQNVTWRDYIETNPSILYTKSDNGVDVRAKMLLSLHSPGVSESLSKSNPLPRIMSMGVYALSRCVAAAKSAFLEGTEIDLRTEKHSLYYWASRVYPNQETVNNMLQLLFPYHDEYEGLMDRLSAFDEDKCRVMPRSSERRRVRSIVKVYSNKPDAEVDLEKLVCDKWFHTNRCKISKLMLISRWEAAQKRIPWLKDDPDSTLKASPFKDHIRLYNFFSSLVPRRRMLRLNGTPAKSVSGYSNIISAIQYDFWGDYTILNRGDAKSAALTTQYANAYHALTLLTKIPTFIDRKPIAEEILQNLVPKDSNPPPFSRRAALQILKTSLSWRVPLADLLENIKAYRLGVIGYFIEPQTWIDQCFKGRGRWIGLIDGVETQITVDDVDGVTYITSVTTSCILEGRRLEKWSLSLLGFADNCNLGVDTPPSLLNRGGWASLSTNGTSIPSRPGFIPVHLLTSMKVGLTEKMVESISIKITDYDIKLMARQKIRGMDEIPILSLKVNAGDLQYNCSEATFNFIRNTYIRKWLGRCALNVQDAYDMFDKFIEGDARQREWIQSQVIYHLRRYGLLTKSAILNYEGEYHLNLPMSGLVSEPERLPEMALTQDIIDELCRQSEQLIALEENTVDSLFDDEVLPDDSEVNYVTSKYLDIRSEVEHPFISAMVEDFTHFRSEVSLLIERKQVHINNANARWVGVIIKSLGIKMTDILYIGATVSGQQRDLDI